MKSHQLTLKSNFSHSTIYSFIQKSYTLSTNSVSGCGLSVWGYKNTVSLLYNWHTTRSYKTWKLTIFTSLRKLPDKSWRKDLQKWNNERSNLSLFLMFRASAWSRTSRSPCDLLNRLYFFFFFFISYEAQSSPTTQSYIIFWHISFINISISI